MSSSTVGALFWTAAVLMASAFGQKPPEAPDSYLADYAPPQITLGLPSTSLPYVPAAAEQSAAIYDLSTFYLRQAFVNGSLYCARLKVTPPTNCTSPCCTAGLRTIDIDTFDTCRPSMTFAYVTVNGVRQSFALNTTGSDSTFRIQRLNLSLSDNGAEICINLKKNAQGQGCATIPELCKTPVDAPNGACRVVLTTANPSCSKIVTSSGEDGIARACVNYQIFATPNVQFPYSIPEDKCDTWADRVTADLKDMALPSGGDAIPCAPTRIVCAPNRTSACVDFPSIKNLVSAGPQVVDSVSFWLSTFDSCLPYMLQYERSISITGPNAKPLFPQATKSIANACSNNRTSNWPSVSCNKTQGVTPFSVSPLITRLPGRTSTTSLFCFTTSASTPADTKSPCGRMINIQKAKFWVNDTYRGGKVKAFGVQPAGSSIMTFRPVTWGAKGENTLKLTPLNWNATQANGGRICLEVSYEIRIGDLCAYNDPNVPSQNSDRRCWVALSDDSLNCCPTSSASL